MNTLQRILIDNELDYITNPLLYLGLKQVNTSMSMENAFNRASGLRHACLIARKYQNPAEILVFLSEALGEVIEKDQDPIGFLERLSKESDPINSYINKRSSKGNNKDGGLK